MPKQSIAAALAAKAAKEAGTPVAPTAPVNSSDAPINVGVVFIRRSHKVHSTGTLVDQVIGVWKNKIENLKDVDRLYAVDRDSKNICAVVDVTGWARRKPELLPSRDAASINAYPDWCVVATGATLVENHSLLGKSYHGPRYDYGVKIITEDALFDEHTGTPNVVEEPAPIVAVVEVTKKAHRN